MSDKRQHERHEFSSPMEYTIIPEAKSKAFRGCIVNISLGGAGFCSYLETPVSRGQQIIVRKSHLPFECSVAVVRWGITSGNSTCLAGLECAGGAEV